MSGQQEIINVLKEANGRWLEAKEILQKVTISRRSMYRLLQAVSARPEIDVKSIDVKKAIKNFYCIRRK